MLLIDILLHCDMFLIDMVLVLLVLLCWFAEDSRFEKYRKMQKILPEAAIRQKMSLDKFSLELIETFFKTTDAYTSAKSLSVAAPELPPQLGT